MKTIEKIEKCSSCNGNGYTAMTEWCAGGSEIIGEEGCYNCGGSGGKHFSSYIARCKAAGNIWGSGYTKHDKPKPFHKGSGKQKVIYEVLSQNCSECNGEGKARYYKGRFSHHQPFGGFKNLEEEEKWINKSTIIKKCQLCNGLGKKTQYVRSEAINPGCFLTTACTLYNGLDDNCYQLNTLRKFRDNYIKNLTNGNMYLTEYYVNAPIILDYLLKSSKRNSEFQYIFGVIKKSIKYIENHEYDKAFKEYETMYKKLYSKYLEEEDRCQVLTFNR